METRLVVVLAFLPVLVACGSGNGDNTSLTVNPGGVVLHLFEADVSEADFESLLSTMEPERKMPLCSFALLGQDEFIKSLAIGDESLERERQAGVTRTPLPYGTPKPGQKSDRQSQERVYAIVRESCETDIAAREIPSP